MIALSNLSLVGYNLIAEVVDLRFERERFERLFATELFLEFYFPVVVIEIEEDIGSISSVRIQLLLRLLPRKAVLFQLAALFFEFCLESIRFIWQGLQGKITLFRPPFLL